MEQNNPTDLFDAAMDANGLMYEKNGDQLIIKKSKNRNNSLRLYMIIAIAAMLIGLFIGLFLPLRIGRYIGGLGFVLFVSTIGLRQRETEAMKNTITINAEQVEIREGYKSRRVKFDDIAEFKTDVKEIGHSYVGSVTIITERGMVYELLEVIGDSEPLVQDDLLIISNYIVEEYING